MSFTLPFPADAPGAASVTGVTCVRDDGSYLLEWIAHHLPCGIGHFVVMSHDCSDGTPQLLDALQDIGLVTHLPFVRKGKLSAQWQAFKLAWGHARVQDADWAIFFDCDEFLWLDPAYQTLQDFVADMDDADAVAIPWLLFGADGQQTRSDAITPRRFQKSAPDYLHFPMAHLFKSVFRPHCFDKPGVHRPRRGSITPAWVGPDRAPLAAAVAEREGNIRLFGQPMGPHRIGLNHYSVRSQMEFAVKVDRGLPNHMTKTIGLDYWVERNWNTQANTRILPMLDQTEAVLARLLENAAVRAAHEACMDHYNQRAEAVLLDEDKVRMLWQFGLLSENRPPTRAEVNVFIRRQIAARAEPDAD